MTTRPILTLLVIVVAASVGPAPRSEPQPVTAPVQPWQQVAPVTAEALSGASLGGVPSFEPAVAHAAREPIASVPAQPEPTGGLAGPLYPASMTWCAPRGNQCTGWGGNARLAAVNSFRFGHEPYWVRITRGDAFADALVVSHCACHGQDGYIDVSPAVFRRLAPLSRGRVDVAVERLSWPYEPGGDPPPHPADDAMRAEDSITPPPTDQEVTP